MRPGNRGLETAAHGPSPHIWSARDRTAGSNCGDPRVGTGDRATGEHPTHPRRALHRLPGRVGSRFSAAFHRLVLYRVTGPLDLASVGILAALVDPLRDKGISVFALSTYDTDCLLLPEVQRADAITALEAAGHRIQR